MPAPPLHPRHAPSHFAPKVTQNVARYYNTKCLFGRGRSFCEGRGGGGGGGGGGGSKHMHVVTALNK